MRARRMIAGVCLTMISAGASAQTLKPGLWEMTHRMKSASGELEKAQALAQQQMAGLPPEQRRMMEEAMAKHGVQMGAGPAGATTVRTCMTKEMAERNEMPVQQGDCRTTKQQRTGNTMRATYVCTNPPSTTEGEYTFVSPEAYTMRTTTHTTIEGRRETMTMEGSGKWLSADCGKLKPIPAPARK